MNKNGKQQRKVYVYTKDLNLITTYPSTASAARELNLSQGNIVLCCQGVLKSYKGMYFSYTPLLTNEDVKKLYEEGEEKRKIRGMQMNLIVSKYRKNNKETTNAISLRYYYNHRDKMLAYQKERYYLKKYGMTELDYKRIKNERTQDQ